MYQTWYLIVCSKEQEPMDNDLYNFLHNYEVNIVNDQKRRAKYRIPQFFTDPQNADVIINSPVSHETERVFTVEIPEGRLKALVELEKRFFKWQKHSRGEVDMFEMLMEKEREETYLRQSNQAVAKAYEQYSICLNLAGYQRKL